MNKEIYHQFKHLVPKQPGILSYDEFLHTAILIPLFETQGDWHLLFEKRAVHIRQGGEVCFPGGYCEKHKDASPLETALRETEEELGIRPEKINLLGQTDTFVASRMMTIESFLGIIDITSLEELNPDPSEVAKTFSLPIKFFMDNPPHRFPVKTIISPRMSDSHGHEFLSFPAAKFDLPQKYHKDWNGGMYEILLYPSPFGPIWGITARFAYGLIKKWKQLGL